MKQGTNILQKLDEARENVDKISNSDYERILWERKGLSQEKQLAWLAETPVNELVAWAEKVSQRRQKQRQNDLPAVPDHLKALFGEPTDKNFDDVNNIVFATVDVYRRDVKQAKRHKPQPSAFEVVKVTDRFVYVKEDDHHGTKRLDRAKLEAGEGLRCGLIYYLFTWEAIKDKWAEFSADWDRQLQEIIDRVDQEYQEAEALGFRCAKCGMIAEGLQNTSWQSEYELRQAGFTGVETPYDGQWVCLTCRKAIAREYWPLARANIFTTITVTNPPLDGFQ